MDPSPIALTTLIALGCGLVGPEIEPRRHPADDLIDAIEGNMVDPANDEIDAVLLAFDRISLRHARAGWIVRHVPAAMIDLLVPGTLRVVLARTLLPEGASDRVRLDVTGAAASEHGARWSLELANPQVTIETRFCVEDGAVVGMPADWDVEDDVRWSITNGFRLDAEVEVPSSTTCPVLGASRPVDSASAHEDAAPTGHGG